MSASDSSNVPSLPEVEQSFAEAVLRRPLSRRQFHGLIGAGAFATALGAAGGLEVFDAGLAAANPPGTGMVLRNSGVVLGSWGGSQSVGNPFGADQTSATDRFGQWRAQGHEPVDLIVDMANGSNGGSGSWSPIEGQEFGLLAGYGTPYLSKMMLSVGAWPIGSLGLTGAAANPSAAWADCAADTDPTGSTTTGHMTGTNSWTNHYVNLVAAAHTAGITTLYLRLFWEFNLGGNAWFATANSTDAANFVTAWQKVVTAIRNKAATYGMTIYIVFCPGAGDGASGGIDELAYPGDSYVDIIAPDVYDTCTNLLPGGGGAYIYPPAGFTPYTPGNSYAVNDKVAYYAGYYKCLVANGPTNVQNPDYHPGVSTTYWAWYPIESFTSTERTALRTSQQAGWNYTLNGSGSSTTRPLEFWRKFADGSALGNYTGGARSGAKRFGITEWGLMGRYNRIDPNTGIAHTGEGKDNPYWMQQMLQYMNTYIPNDGVAYDTIFLHDVSISTQSNDSEWHNIGAPWGEYSYEANYAPYVAFPRSGFIYQCAFARSYWIFNGGHGTSGTAVSPSDTASGDPVTFVIQNSPATTKYSNTHVPHSYSTSVLCDSVSSSQACYIEKNYTGTSPAISVPTPSMRAYFYRTANPGVTMTLMRVLIDATHECYRVQLNSSGQLFLSDATGSMIGTYLGAAIPLNAWFRIDAAVNISTGDWQLVMTTAQSGDDPMYEYKQSGSPYTSPSTAGNFGSSTAVATIFKFGNCVSTNSGQTWMADCVVGDGPAGPWVSGEVSDGHP